jgi:hypothetical protein
MLNEPQAASSPSSAWWDRRRSAADPTEFWAVSTVGISALRRSIRCGGREPGEHEALPQPRRPTESTIHTGRSCTASRPISARFEPVPRLRSFATGSCRIPSDLARRTQPVWQYQAVPALSALLPTLPGVSRIRLRSASTGLLQQPSERHCTSFNTERLTAHRRLVAQAGTSATPPGLHPAETGIQQSSILVLTLEQDEDASSQPARILPSTVATDSIRAATASAAAIGPSAAVCG